MEDQFIGKYLENRYEILEKIGTGGMAVVYKARCHRLNRFVAIKILKADLAQDPDLRRRFYAESQAVAMLSHPNIVSVYDVSHSENIDYIVMELIEGITLKQYINRKGILNWKEVLHFSTQIAKALQHAHSRGIIHRDIKPQNIMVLKDGSVKVADFGIARLLTTQNTLTQEALGSVHYISPEQAKGGQVDARSDLYSLGVVMYEMLTSRLPFEGDSPVSIAIQHISSIPLMPREINPDIPVGLEEITMRAMNPDLDARYQSADELLADLEEFRKNPAVVFGYASMSSYGESMDSTRVLPKSAAVVPPREPAARKHHSGGAIGRNHVPEEEYKKNRKRAGKTSTLVGILFIIVFLIGLGWFMWKYTVKDWLNPTETRIEVPKFVGQVAADVMANSEYTSKYTFTTVDGESDSYGAGYVIDQDPAAGRSVTVTDAKISVTLTVSTGKQAVSMPDIMNKDYREAKNQLEKLSSDYGLGLDIKEEAKNDDSVTSGFVMEQIPASGAELTKGMTVYITYSVGPDVKLTIVPDVTGLTEQQGIERLQSKNLSYDVTYEHNEAKAGTIFFQDHQLGDQVEEKTAIKITVSLGPEATSSAASSSESSSSTASSSSTPSSESSSSAPSSTPSSSESGSSSSGDTGEMGGGNGDNLKPNG